MEINLTKQELLAIFEKLPNNALYDIDNFMGIRPGQWTEDYLFKITFSFITDENFDIG